VRELADRLQLRHHSVVELVNRAQGQGLVERAAHPDDARAVRVLLTDDGEAILARLSALHRDELRRMELALSLPRWHDEGDRPGGRVAGPTAPDLPAGGPCGR
jgi:DNA-binding MarR family transcriptional regulator